MRNKAINLEKNAQRFSGRENVDVYDHYRPAPPPDLVQLIMQYRNEKIGCLLDVGCGSGLSTMPWVDHVEHLIAIDPSGDMLSAASEKLTRHNNCQVVKAFAHDIPLEDEFADVITCSQAFHWMEPKSTLKEFNRLLKPNGIFVVFDCLWPPSINVTWELEFIKLFDRIRNLSNDLQEPLMHFWNKDRHCDNMSNSGYFSHVKKVGFHKKISMTSEYFIGLAESQGGLQALRKIGMSDDEIGWNTFVKKIIAYPLESGSMATLHYNAIFSFKN